MTTTQLPYVAVLHGPLASATLPQITAAANDLCRVRIFLRTDLARQAPRLVELASRLAEVALYQKQDQGAIFEQHDLVGIEGVTTFRDDCVEDMEALADFLALPGGSSEAAPDRWRKDTQRRIFREGELCRNRSTTINRAQDLRAAIETIGVPGFLKAVRGTGSRDVIRVVDVDEQSPVLDSLSKSIDEDGMQFVYEEEIRGDGHPGARWLGDYVSVETASTRDRHFHFAISDRLPTADGVRETGILAPTLLPKDGVRDDVLTAADKALDALDVHDRITHTEMKLTSTGPQVVEVNGRLGGDIERLQTSLGMSRPVRMALELALGRTVQVVMPPPSRDVMTSLNFPAPSGAFTVRRAMSPRELQGLPGVVGMDRVQPAGSQTDSRVGTASSLADLWLRGDSAAGLARTLQHSIEMLEAKFVLDPSCENRWARQMRELLEAT